MHQQAFFYDIINVQIATRNKTIKNVKSNIIVLHVFFELTFVNVSFVNCPLLAESSFVDYKRKGKIVK
jgi:hypothetical protein